ncbi:DNA (cytosine-5-)-methyltransferase [Draconibacterium sp.]|uniref:DNA (cytosine-5-)-methyltransferase n=1 Tax=Draconibacterium sp. TaxID=1965318 RepID=UPI003562D710
MTNNIQNHITREYEGIVLERFKHLKQGGKMGDLPAHLQHESFIRKGDKKTGGPNMRLYRLEYNVPALTVTAFIFNKFVHPNEDRYITPREAACLQDFPVNWEFKGTLGQVQKQIGNAVPVNLASAVANSVKEYLLKSGEKGTIKIASFFTGAGGLDLGFENVSDTSINFETLFSSDIEEWAENTIKSNRPDWNFIRKDIRELSSKTVIEIIGDKPDIIIGGPPCQPFSVAGKQKAIKDPLGRLYSDFIKQVKLLQPKVVIMENVYGLTQVKSANMLELIRESYKEIGYNVVYKELNSADYGTPQKRRRVFFVAAKDISQFSFPLPTHCSHPNLLGLPLYKGAGEVLESLPSPEIRNNGTHTQYGKKQ